MNTDKRAGLLSGRPSVDGCCPASSCWETMIQNNLVKAASATVTPAILHNRSPLGLSVYAPESTLACNTTGAAFQSNSCLLDGLLREINHRKKMFSERLIPWLKWQVPHHLLDSTDVTQLMYCVGRQFQLSDSRSNFYCVSFRLQEVNAERLALFRGLGFNAIEIRIAPQEPCQAETLASCVALAGDFHFQHLGIEWQTSSAELYPALINTIQLPGRRAGRQPESITFKPAEAESPSTSALLQTLYRGLTDSGYEVLGNDVFVRPDSPLAQAQQYGQVSRNLQGYNCQQVMDILGLGPGNTSTLGALRMTNASSLSKYLHNSFDHYRQETVTPAIREVIDQLLCYHQLNLIYFKEQHQLDLEYLFSQLSGSAEQNSSTGQQTLAGHHRLPAATRLYDLKNHTLALTTSGILQLSSLCQALSQVQAR